MTDTPLTPEPAGALLDRKLLIVTGKGGVGKTTVALGLARNAAARGKRVLVCEIERTGDIARPFVSARAASGATPSGVDFIPKEVEPNLFIMGMDTEAALEEYLSLNLKIPFAMRMGSVAKALDFVAVAAPGVREVLTIGKVCWDVKRELFDLVIVDAPSSGHVISQLDAPDSVGELVQVGPLVSQTDWMKDILRDPHRTAAVVVTTPEEIPVSETIELLDQLRAKTQTPIGAVAVNRVLPELFVRADEPVFTALRGVEDIDSLTPGLLSVLDVAEFSATLRRAQDRNLEVLRQVLSLTTESGTELIYVPETFTEVGTTASAAERASASTDNRDQVVVAEVTVALRSELG